MRARSLFLAVACLSFMTAGAVAQNVSRNPVSGDKVEKRTQIVMKAYNWSASVAELKERAEKARKLIFWLQIVGDLDGGL